MTLLSCRRRPGGFTLIEILVAMALVALSSLMAYRGVGALVDGGKHLTGEAQHWLTLERFMAQFENDILYISTRSVRDEGGLLLPPFVGRAVVARTFDTHMEVTRFGRDDLDPPSLGRRIGYRFVPPRVELLVWPVLDRAPRTQPEVVTVLEDVRDFQLRYLGPDNQWRTEWPIAGGRDVLPRAVTLTMELTDGTRFERVVARP